MRIAFDYLVVAIGARRLEAIEGAVCFGGPADRAALERVLSGASAGTVQRIAFAAPAELAWILPLYELALLTAAWAARCELELELSIVTPEARPLEAFGAGAADTVAGLLADAGVAMHAECAVERFEAGKLIGAGGFALDADAVIALPALAGPAIDGLPHDERGFIPTDSHGAVRGAAGVYAAGDGTAFPIKQGGLAAQQADAVASAIAAELDAVATAEPFRPVLRGHAADRRRAALSARRGWWRVLGGRLPAALVAAQQGRRPLPRAIPRCTRGPELLREPFADREAPAGGSPAQASEDERDAVELLLELADANARRGSYDFAIKCLNAAEDVGGPLPAARARKRREWEQRRAARARYRRSVVG